MFNYKFTIFLLYFLFFISLAGLLFNSTIEVWAAGIDDARSGLNVTANKAYLDNNNNGNDIAENSGIPVSIPTTIGKIIGSVLAFVGVLFLILMIYGGLTWMTARGNEQEIEKAKETITNAVIGLIIVLAAYAITAYIGNVLTSK